MIRMFAAGQPNLGGAVNGSNAVQPSADFQRNALLLEEIGDDMHILIVCCDDLTLFIWCLHHLTDDINAEIIMFMKRFSFY